MRLDCDIALPGTATTFAKPGVVAGVVFTPTVFKGIFFDGRTSPARDINAELQNQWLVVNQDKYALHTAVSILRFEAPRLVPFTHARSQAAFACGIGFMGVDQVSSTDIFTTRTQT